MDTIKKLWWLAFPIGYGIPAIIMLVYLLANDCARPIRGAILWPIRLLIGV